MFFYVMTKNLNWKILTKNFNFYVRFTKNQYKGGNCLKRGLVQFANLRGGLMKKRGWCFRGGG